jgi:hypothetical protein
VGHDIAGPEPVFVELCGDEPDKGGDGFVARFRFRKVA